MFHLIRRSTPARFAAVFGLALLTGAAVVLGVLAAGNLVPGEEFAGTLGATAVAWLVLAGYGIVQCVAGDRRRLAHKAARRVEAAVAAEHAATRAQVESLRGEFIALRGAVDDQHVADLFASVEPNVRRLH